MKYAVQKILIIFLIGLLHIPCYAQTTIQMEKVGGVYKIPCTVNGLKLKMIFDSGASTVCLSENTALMMLENDYLSIEDIKGSGKSTVADGSIVDHTKINLKKIQIGDKVLTNVEAVVIHGQEAPLLFGQSAIRRLGKYTISGNTLILGSSNSSPQKKLTDQELDQLLEEANNAYFDDAYYIALEKYKILYDHDWINAIGIIRYADCYYYTGRTEDALALYQSIQNEIETNFPDSKIEVYFQIGRCLNVLKNYDEMFPYMEKVKYSADSWSFYEKSAIFYIMDAYYQKGDEYRAKSVIDNYISKYLSFKNLSPTDCWTRNSRDQFLAELYWFRSIATYDYAINEKYIIISAQWGWAEAIKECQERKIWFHIQPTNYTY